MLKDISVQNKKWGREWYDFIEISMFEEAKYAVIMHGIGEMVAVAVNRIDELAALEAHMKELERGENK